MLFDHSIESVLYPIVSNTDCMLTWSKYLCERCNNLLLLFESFHVVVVRRIVRCSRVLQNEQVLSRPTSSEMGSQVGQHAHMNSGP